MIQNSSYDHCVAKFIDFDVLSICIMGKQYISYFICQIFIKLYLIYEGGLLRKVVRGGGIGNFSPAVSI